MHQPNANILGIDIGNTECRGSVLTASNGVESVSVPMTVLIGEEKLLPGVGGKSTTNITNFKGMLGQGAVRAGAATKEVPYIFCVDSNCPSVQFSVPSGARVLISLEELLGCILFELRCLAEVTWERSFLCAVICVPAYFTDSQRQATLNAGQLAGLQVMRLINDSNALALGYLSSHLRLPSLNQRLNEIVATFDFGDSGFSASILACEGKQIQCLACCGSSKGIGEIEVKMANYFCDKFLKENLLDKGDIHCDAWWSLQAVCRKALCLLSTEQMAPIFVEEFVEGKNLHYSIRQNFLVKLFEETLLEVKKISDGLLESCQMNALSVDRIIVGGKGGHATCLKQLICGYFRSSKKVVFCCNQSALSSAGCSSIGQLLFDSDVELKTNFTECTTCSLSLVFRLNGTPLSTIKIKRFTPLPYKYKSSILICDEVVVTSDHSEVTFLPHIYEEDRDEFESVGLRFFFDINGNGITSIYGEYMSGKRCFFSNDKLCSSPSASWKAASSLGCFYPSADPLGTTNTEDLGTEVSTLVTARITADNVTANCDNEYVMGLDWGDTTCRVEVLDASSFARIFSASLPSIVAFNENWEPIIGEVAKEYCDTQTGILFGFRRLLGRSLHNPLIVNEMRRMPFHLTEDTDGRLQIEITKSPDDSRTFSVEHLVSLIFSDMKSCAEKAIGHHLSKAVISIPCCFCDAQRQSIMNAGLTAGIDVLRLISEPAAVALAYTFNQREQATEILSKNIVLCFGHTSTESTLFKMSNQLNSIAALSTSGCPNLGGVDVDRRLSVHCMSSSPWKLSDVSATDLLRLTQASKDVKEELTHQCDAQLRLTNWNGVSEFIFNVSRSDFEKLTSEIFQRAVQTISDCIQCYKKNEKNDSCSIDRIILCGGMTRHLALDSCMLKMFEKDVPVIEFLHSMQNCAWGEPDNVVAFGSAIQACLIIQGMLAGDRDTSIVKEILGREVRLTIRQGGDCSTDLNQLLVLPATHNIPSTSSITFSAEHKGDLLYNELAGGLGYQTSFSLPANNNVEKDDNVPVKFSDGILPNDADSVSSQRGIRLSFSIDANGTFAAPSFSEI